VSTAMKYFGGMAVFLLLGLALIAGGKAQQEPSRGYPSYNDYARLIAGMKTPESPLVGFQKDPAWTYYAPFVDVTWEGFERRQLRLMRQWVSQELGTAETATAFYPFSGPDFLNISTLFPEARTYIMVALEPVGTLPDFAAINLKDYFADLEDSLRVYLYVDFFITAKMASQISLSELQGVLPVILFFMAREHARVLDVSYVALKADGSQEELPALEGGNPGPGIPGLRIVFEAPGSSEKKTLYYFRFNLQNGSWKRNPQFASFLNGFGPLTTFTKSASYLLFSPSTSDLRHFILKRSDCVLQDDSGIPLKDFDLAVWNLKFYGTYVRPTSLFSDRYQKDLAEVYNRGRDVYPLPFGIGYAFRPGTSNLIFASKKPGLSSKKLPQRHEILSYSLAGGLADGNGK
jgi:hypothetical protein